MGMMSFFRTKRERVIKEWTEQKFGTQVYRLYGTKAKHVRELVVELDRLGIPDEAELDIGYGSNIAKWDQTEARAEVSEEDAEDTA